MSSDAGAAYIHPVGWEITDGWTYLIQQGTDGPVKIGSSKTNGRRRLAELQAANPEPLRLICLLLARRTEPVLQERFKERRIRGEWFHPSVLDDVYADDELSLLIDLPL